MYPYITFVSQPPSKMAQIFIFKCKCDQIKILMVIHYLYCTLDDRIIIPYVPSNIFSIHKMLLKKWVKHSVQFLRMGDELCHYG